MLRNESLVPNMAVQARNMFLKLGHLRRSRLTAPLLGESLVCRPLWRETGNTMGKCESACKSIACLPGVHIVNGNAAAFPAARLAVLLRRRQWAKDARVVLCTLHEMEPIP
jgi:hypothetical protein